MQLEIFDQILQIENEDALEKALSMRDGRGGAHFWLSPGGTSYPSLSARICGNIGDIHYFPLMGHPGFRRPAKDAPSRDGFTMLVYEGCDPKDGEATPNEFVITFQEIVEVAKDFLQSGEIRDLDLWLEL